MTLVWILSYLAVFLLGWNANNGSKELRYYLSTRRDAKALQKMHESAEQPAETIDYVGIQPEN